MLSDKQIQKLPPGLHADDGGLYIRVRPSGRKTWVRRTQRDGNDRSVTIGEYPRMSLAEARRGLNSTDFDLAAGVKLYQSKLSVRRPEQVDALLAPLLGLKKLSAATKPKLVEMLQEKAKTAPTHANRMLSRWKDFFNFCEQQGWIDSNPIGSVQRKFIGGKEHSRSRVVEWAELTEIPIALLFILLSGLRPTEAIWVLRHKRTSGIPTKTTPHWIPNTPLVRWFLRQDLPLPASHLTWSNYLRRKGVTWRPHDLRRTFATRLNDLGVAPHVVEKMLNHKLQGVMAVYNHAEYRAERIAAQRLWERELLRRRKNAPD